MAEERVIAYADPAVAGKVPQKKRKNALRRRKNITGWAFIALPLIGTVVFSIIPTLMSLYLSMTFWRGYTNIWQAEWIGFENYYNILFGVYSGEFYKSILNTLILMIQLPVSMFLSLVLAVALNRRLVGAGFFRVVYYIPSLVTSVVVVLIFQNLFDTNGVINSFLSLFGVEKTSWLSVPGRASVVIIALSVWKNIGGTLLMYMAGLQGIEGEYYEAARLDGAGGAVIFWKITLPLLQPMTFYLLITGIIGGFQAFNEPFLMYQYNYGFGPESSTETVMVFMYYQYSNNSMMGLASAISWVLAAIIFVITAIQFAYNRHKDKEVN